MSAYVVGDIHITDLDSYKAHVPAALATVARFGGHVIAGGGKLELLDGEPMPERVVIIEFPDAETARDLQRLSSQLLTAQEEERRSIARELHDEVGQVLTAIKVELVTAQRQVEASGGDSEALASVRSIADGALSTVRDLSHLLHPAMLDDLGLPAAIEWYAKGFERRHGVRVDILRDHMEDRLAGDVEAAIYRIVQEALTNVARHAQATRCRIYLQRLPHTLLVTIEDDGVGFDPSATPRGLGLISIRERVAQVRGELRLEATPGKGTRLTVEVPALNREQAQLAHA